MEGKTADIRGVVRPSGKSGSNRFLSDVIVELGFADRETVDRALDEERRRGKRMGRLLVEKGALTEQQLAIAIAERYGLDYLDLDEFEVDPGAANLITRAAASRYETVPVKITGADTLLIAISDPTDGFALSDIAVMTRLEVQPAVAARSDILALIERLPHAKHSPAKANRREIEAGPKDQPAPEPQDPLAELRAEVERLREEVARLKGQVESLRTR